MEGIRCLDILYIFYKEFHLPELMILYSSSNTDIQAKIPQVLTWISKFRDSTAKLKYQNQRLFL